jgi:hypothetical protein
MASHAATSSTQPAARKKVLLAAGEAVAEALPAAEAVAVGVAAAEAVAAALALAALKLKAAEGDAGAERESVAGAEREMEALAHAEKEPARAYSHAQPSHAAPPALGEADAEGVPRALGVAATLALTVPEAVPGPSEKVPAPHSAVAVAPGDALASAVAGGEGKALAEALSEGRAAAEGVPLTHCVAVALGDAAGAALGACEGEAAAEAAGAALALGDALSAGAALAVAEAANEALTSTMGATEGEAAVEAEKGAAADAEGDSSAVARAVADSVAFGEVCKRRRAGATPPRAAATPELEAVAHVSHKSSNAAMPTGHAQVFSSSRTTRPRGFEPHFEKERLGAMDWKNALSAPDATVVALLPPCSLLPDVCSLRARITAGPSARHALLSLLSAKRGLLRVFSLDALFDLFLPSVSMAAGRNLAGGAPLLAPGPCGSCGAPPAARGGCAALLAARWLCPSPPSCGICGAALQPLLFAGLGARPAPASHAAEDLRRATVLLALGAPLGQPPFSELAALAGPGCAVVEARGGAAGAGAAPEGGGAADALPPAAAEEEGAAADAAAGGGGGGGGDSGSDGAGAEAFAAEWGAPEEAQAPPPGGGAAAAVVASPLGADAAAEALAAALGWAEELRAELAALRARAAEALAAAAGAAAAEAAEGAAAVAAARAAGAAAAAAAAAAPPLSPRAAAAPPPPGSAAASIAAALAAAAAASAGDAEAAAARLRAAGMDVLGGAWEGRWEDVGAAEASFARVFEAPPHAGEEVVPLVGEV